MAYLNEYEEQAREFLNRNGLRLTIGEGEIVEKWGSNRYAYKCRLYNGRKSYGFTFYDSVQNFQNNEEPRAYDILACLNGYDVGTFDEFCDEYGYFPIADRKRYKEAQETYKACKREYEGLKRILTPEQLEELQEIQ